MRITYHEDVVAPIDLETLPVSDIFITKEIRQEFDNKNCPIILISKTHPSNLYGVDNNNVTWRCDIHFK